MPTEVETALCKHLYGLMTKVPSHLKICCAEACLEVMKGMVSEDSPLLTTMTCFLAVARCHEAVSEEIRRDKNCHEEVTNGTDE